jgi:hypothetical protein
MIAVDQIMPMLLEACPSFAEPWREHLAWWAPDAPGIFNNTGELATHLVDCLYSGRTQEFTDVFNVIETLIEHGSEDVQSAATIGLLESLQNIASHRLKGYADFEKWLGARALDAWRKIEQGWTGASSSPT